MNKALTESLVSHLLIIFIFVIILSMNKREVIETFNFTIVEKEVIEMNKSPKIVINADTSLPIPSKTQKKIREVFGVKRNTLTSDKGTVTAKVGNTLTKKEDDKELQDDESDSLPQAAEEFLITSMPRAINEVRPEYPKWAKEQKVSGSVIFEILIDKNGDVRQAKLVRGLNPKLDQLAKAAILKFKFKPAYIEKKPAAVRIKYAIKYLLES